MDNLNVQSAIALSPEEIITLVKLVKRLLDGAVPLATSDHEQLVLFTDEEYLDTVKNS